MDNSERHSGTVQELITLLTKMVQEGALTGSEIVSLEGCDCTGDWGGGAEKEKNFGDDCLTLTRKDNY